MLAYDFMRKAFLMGGIIAIIAPAIGYFLVLRRMSIIGDTLSHVALAGAALGMVTNVYPIYTAILLSILASLGIESLRERYEDYAELPLAIILSGGVGLASIFLSMGHSQGVLSYLFGSLALVNNQDIILVIILAILILLFTLYYFQSLFYIAFDEESAKVAGIKVDKINRYFSILVGLTVAISMRIVGVLLISSLMVIPVATSLLISNGFKRGLLYSIIFGLVSVFLGLTLSFYLDVSPGGSIVLTSIIVLIIIMIISKKNN